MWSFSVCVLHLKFVSKFSTMLSDKSFNLMVIGTNRNWCWFREITSFIKAFYNETAWHWFSTQLSKLIWHCDFDGCLRCWFQNLDVSRSWFAINVLSDFPSILSTRSFATASGYCTCSIISNIDTVYICPKVSCFSVIFVNLASYSVAACICSDIFSNRSCKRFRMFEHQSEIPIIWVCDKHLCCFHGRFSSNW